MPKLDAQWVIKVVNHPYTLQDYARFQAELRMQKKPGLLEMMQRLLREKQQTPKP